MSLLLNKSVGSFHMSQKVEVKDINHVISYSDIFLSVFLKKKSLKFKKYISL